MMVLSCVSGVEESNTGQTSNTDTCACSNACIALLQVLACGARRMPGTTYATMRASSSSSSRYNSMYYTFLISFLVSSYCLWLAEIQWQYHNLAPCTWVPFPLVVHFANPLHQTNIVVHYNQMQLSIPSSVHYSA